ncbi:MAG: cytochrome c-type biogenesis protein CcmH [Devosiaceae bacterium]|nr:cytochrome c-type biogenesis protein CcmH [Devosiaceae bacterium]
MNFKKLFLAFSLVFSLLTPIAAFAVLPSEILDDPVLEERARDLSKNLRCLVCQNQNIDESDAPLAADLRVLVRERLIAGDSNKQVIDYVVARYGEYVLLNPVLGPHTIILWTAMPIILLGGGIFLFFLVKRRKKTGKSISLSKEEKAALAELEKHDV